MLQQALELRIELLVVTYAFDVVAQRDPFDMQDRYSDAQRTVRQYEAFDIYLFGSAPLVRNHCSNRAKAMGVSNNFRNR